jgi:hypothetical protein
LKTFLIVFHFLRFLVNVKDDVSKQFLNLDLLVENKNPNPDKKSSKRRSLTFFKMFKKKNFLENSTFIFEKLKPKKKRSNEISFKKIRAEKDFITFI